MDAAVMSRYQLATYAAYDELGAGIFVQDGHGRLIYANQSLADLLGYADADALLAAVREDASMLYADPAVQGRLLGRLDADAAYADEDYDLRHASGRSVHVLDAAVRRAAVGQVEHYVSCVIGADALHEVLQQLQNTDDMYRVLADCSLEGVYVAAGDHTIWANATLAEMSGRRVTELRSIDVAQLFVESQREEIRVQRTQQPDEFGFLRFESRVRNTVENREIPVEVTERGVHYAGRTFRVGILRDLSRQFAVQKQLVHDALHDPLTGLPNRKMFLELLQRRMDARVGATKGRFALLFLDLDGFKLINDSLGHAYGDEFLRSVAERLQEALRPADVIARHGGDEFTILLENISQDDDAVRVSERILEHLSQPFCVDGVESFSSASIGIVHDSPRYQSPLELLRDADTAMYRAKAAGKARIAVFNHDMHRATSERLKLENELRNAVRGEQFFLVYQPLFDLETGNVECAEALLRWAAPDGRVLAPAQFLGVLEESGMGVDVGRWVVDRVLQDARELEAQVSLPRNFGLHANIGARSFQQEDFWPSIRDALAGSGVSGERLILEITEHVFLADPDTASKLHRCREAGLRVFIDDFGVGYSSLSALRELPLDAVKLDRSFVTNVERSSRDVAVFRKVIELAHELELETIAEGVETEGQHRVVMDAGCQYGQGYFYSRPVDFHQLLKRLSSPPGLVTPLSAAAN